MPRTGFTCVIVFGCTNAPPPTTRETKHREKVFAPWLAWEGIQLYRNIDTIKSGVRSRALPATPSFHPPNPL